MALTDDGRRRLSDASRRSWADPVERDNRIDAICCTLWRSDVRERMSLAARRRAADPEYRRKRGWRLDPERVEVPGWVEAAGLADVYRTTAKRYDEHAAARECRRLKREAQQLSEMR
jgi:hypothetical protein